MRLDARTMKLLGELEYLVGSQCYNPNSYDGWNDVEGCEFRYPISVPDEDGKYEKYRSNLGWLSTTKSDLLTESSVKYMKYKFGSNELFIGLGLWDVLDYLEERYGINFNELEEKIADE